MPIHPAPPQDLPGLVAGYRHTVQAMLDLGTACPPAAFEQDTPCPGWTVRDLISHVAAVEAYLHGAEHPGVELPPLEHVHHEFAAWMEVGVQVRRSRAGADVVAELATLLPQRLSDLSDPGLELTSEVRAPMGRTMALGELLRLRLTDIWTHEQDLREALDRPGNLDTTGAAITVEIIDRSFPAILGNRVQPPEGTTVILDCTGPVTLRTGARMTQDAQGRPWAQPLFSGEPAEEAGSAQRAGATGDRSTTITLSTEALTRRAAGRRTTEHTAYRVNGDEALAARVLDVMVITP